MATLKRVVVPAVLVLLLVAAAFTMFRSDDTKTLTAHFPRTISIYEGSDVRVLGVPVGTVDKVTPSGTDVVVTMHYDADVQVPEDAKAAIVAPSVVGDRFIQLTPVYTGGAVLADDATLSRGPDGRTAGARPDLLEHRRPHRRPRPDRRQQGGCAHRPARESTAANFGGQGAKFNTDHQGLQQAQRHPRRQQGGALRLRPQAGGLHRHARHQRQDRTPLQRLARRRVVDAVG